MFCKDAIDTKGQSCVGRHWCSWFLLLVISIPGFKIRMYPADSFCCLCTSDSSNSPLVWHLPNSRQPTRQLIPFPTYLVKTQWDPVKVHTCHCQAHLLSHRYQPRLSPFWDFLWKKNVEQLLNLLSQITSISAVILLLWHDKPWHHMISEDKTWNDMTWHYMTWLEKKFQFIMLNFMKWHLMIRNFKHNYNFSKLN